MSILAGALGGLGQGLVSVGEQMREEAREKRKTAQRQAERLQGRQWDIEDRNARNSEWDRRTESERGYEEGQKRETISRGAAALTGGKSDFVSKIMPIAKKVGEEIGVDPQIIVAQAALESGWGKKAPGNNFFGIKSHGKPGGNSFTTTEVVDGKPIKIKDSFRAYEGIEDSVRGYADFLLKNPRYREMLEAGDLESQLDALGRSGYATDPKYTQKLRSIIGQINATSGAQDLAEVIADPDQTPQVRELAVEGLGPSTAKRKIIKGADGFNYYEDNGERVLPGVQRQPSDEYERYAAEQRAAGEEPVSRIDYSQAKKGNGTTVEMPDGTRVQVGGSTKFTEGQSKDNVYATRAEGALEVLEPIADQLVSRTNRAADLDPTGLAREMQDPQFQVAKQAGDEFLQAILRKDTGAAITQPEQELYGITYLPQPGDQPAVLAAKSQSRRRALEALKSGMSPAQMIAQELALERSKGAQGGNATAPTPPPPPSASDISRMDMGQLNQLDIMSLSLEQVDEAERRYRELQGGPR